MNTLTDDEVLELMRRIEAGEVTLTAREDPEEVYAGNVAYDASSGHLVVVFNDCCEWDYLDSVEAPDGRQWTFAANADGPSTPAMKYRPPDDVCERVYGISG